MAVQAKITSGDIVYGRATVSRGDAPAQYYDPAPTGGNGGPYLQRWASGDALVAIDTLNRRYRAAPTGWSA